MKYKRYWIRIGVAKTKVRTGSELYGRLVRWSMVIQFVWQWDRRSGCLEQLKIAPVILLKPVIGGWCSAKSVHSARSWGMRGDIMLSGGREMYWESNWDSNNWREPVTDAFWEFWALAEDLVSRVIWRCVSPSGVIFTGWVVEKPWLKTRLWSATFSNSIALTVFKSPKIANQTSLWNWKQL